MTETSSGGAAATIACGHLYGWGNSPTAASAQRDPLLAAAAEQLRISIVVPTLNQGETIEDTLLSILHQNHTNREVIVVDGGSTDATLAVLERYRPLISTVISEPDRGQSDAINKGFRLASGDIFCWLNSDDYFLPDALAHVAACFAAAPQIRFAVGAGDVISKDHGFLRHIPALPMNEDTLLNWKNDRWVMQQSCFWSGSLWREVGGVDEQLHLLMDYDLWFRLSRAAETATIDHKLAVMRYYPEAKTVKQRSKTSEELAYVYAKNGAYQSLRELVAELMGQRALQEAYLHRINKSPSVRLLKRLSLFPQPD
jgi:glycosyltransferase involved in cell wall biosynthesis